MNLMSKSDRLATILDHFKVFRCCDGMFQASVFWCFVTGMQPIRNSSGKHLVPNKREPCTLDPKSMH